MRKKEPRICKQCKINPTSRQSWQKAELREKMIAPFLKKLQARTLTDLEKQMLDIIKKHNLPYKYTGNGSFWIGYPPKNPDFVNINGDKNLIEVGNIYHHPTNKMEERRNHYRKYGWESYFFITQKLNEKEILQTLMGRDKIILNPKNIKHICETDRDMETGQMFCLTHQEYICSICKSGFVPKTDQQAKCANCLFEASNIYGQY